MSTARHHRNRNCGVAPKPPTAAVYRDLLVKSQARAPTRDAVAPRRVRTARHEGFQSHRGSFGRHIHRQGFPVVDRQGANHGVAGTRTVTPIGDRADWRDETSGDVEANVLATACMRCNAPSFLWPSEYSYRLCADSFVQWGSCPCAPLKALPFASAGWDATRAIRVGRPLRALRSFVTCIKVTSPPKPFRRSPKR